LFTRILKLEHLFLIGDWSTEIRSIIRNVTYILRVTTAATSNFIT